MKKNLLLSLVLFSCLSSLANTFALTSGTSLTNAKVESVYIKPEPIDVTLNQYGYSTFYYSNADYTIPEGVSVYYVESLTSDNKSATLMELTDVIPAGCAVIVHGDKNAKITFSPITYSKVVLPDYFSDSQEGGIPEGFFVKFGNENRVAPNIYRSGSRLIKFHGQNEAEAMALMFWSDYVEYGSLDGYKLPLQAGKVFNFHFYAAAWKDDGEYMKFEILNETNDIVYSKVIHCSPNYNGNNYFISLDRNTKVDIEFIPEEDGNYKLRWIPATGESGNQGSYNNVLLFMPTAEKEYNIASEEESTQGIISSVENLLQGTDEATALSGDNAYYYLSANGSEETIGFYRAKKNENGEFVNGAHKAYLVIPNVNNEDASANVINFDIITGLSKVITKEEGRLNNQMYNISGQCVDDNYKGIVIVKGKKVIRK